MRCKKMDKIVAFEKITTHISNQIFANQMTVNILINLKVYQCAFLEYVMYGKECKKVYTMLWIKIEEIGEKTIHLSRIIGIFSSPLI